MARSGISSWHGQAKWRTLAGRCSPCLTASSTCPRLPCLPHGSETISREDLKGQLLQSSNTTLEQIMKQANVRHFVAPSSPGRKQLPRGAGSRETQQEGYSLCASWKPSAARRGAPRERHCAPFCRLSEKPQSLEPVNPTRQDRVRGARLSKFSDQRAQSRGSGR